MPTARSIFTTLALSIICSPSFAQAPAKPNIFDAREVTFTADDTLTTVNIAIWDTGTDLALFRGQVFTDMTSGGIRSDFHDIAYDAKRFPARGDILRLDATQAAQYPTMVGFIKGLADRRLGLDTPDSALLKQKLASMSAADAAAFLEQVEFFRQYVHGTQTAILAARGNPAVRIGVGRIGFDWHTMPPAPTEDLARRTAAADLAYVDWFDSNTMRVVSVGFTVTLHDYESALEKTNPTGDATERKALAKKLFAMERTALFDSMKSSSNILFICPGEPVGKDPADEAIPASFKLPNVLTVGAVDQAGDDTPFTSHADYVQVYANGSLVDTSLPAGYKLRFSGPSMASASAVNLAAKLLAVNTNLTPEQIIHAILEGSTPSPDGKRHLLNPTKSIDLAKAMVQPAAAPSGKKKK